MVVANSPISLVSDRAASVLLRDISWDGYCALRDEIGDDPVHLTYDDGFLEIEVPSKQHETLKRQADDMIVTTLKRRRVLYQPAGATTWKRRDILKGIEADECYYIQNAARIRGKTELDLLHDPPPDLAVEADLSGTVIDKLSIYAGLGIKEVWHLLESGEVKILVLGESGVYMRTDISAAVPPMTAGVVERFLKMLPPWGTLMHSEVAIEFENWLDQNL